jgi:hemoglobin-like flavoprotein
MHGVQPSATTDSLTASEIQLIRDSFDRVSVGLRFSRNFYAHLFEIAPELRRLFPDDLTAQVRKLMDMLAALVGKLDRPHELVLTLEALGAQHRDYGVSPAHFAPVGRALFETLESELGPCFDDATRRAWIALYALASAWMQQSFPGERCA